MFGFLYTFFVVRFPKLKCTSCLSCGGNQLIKRGTNEMCIIITLKGNSEKIDNV